MSTELTDRLLARIQTEVAAGREPLVIFDLDGTLYDNAPRKLRILVEYLRSRAQDLPELRQRVEALTPKDVGYDIPGTLRSLGVADDGLIDAAQRFWVERFFTNEYIIHDLPNPGAAAFVQRVHAAGGVPVYLTGRDAPRMLLGTLKVLQRDGFPVGLASTRIILKDDAKLADLAYKSSLVPRLRRTGEVVGAFDNEPGICNMFAEAFPDAAVGWLRTVWSDGAPDPAPEVSCLPHFSALLPPSA